MLLGSLNKSGRILVRHSQRAGKFELTQFAVFRFWRVRLV